MEYVVGTNPAVSRGRYSSSHLSHGGRRRSERRPRTQTVAEPLAEIVESAILPRLMAAHGMPLPGIAIADPAEFQPALNVDLVVSLAMSTEADALLDHVEQLLRRGASVERLFVDLLAPVARHLGELWEEDRCDFVEVTMGLWRLQEIVHELAARLPSARGSGNCGHSALFAAMPGDQHSFGTILVDETFRREGWKTDVVLDPTTSELVDHLARNWFDMVGLTVSCDCNIEPLRSLIHAIRSVSRNPRIIVMVGGRVFAEDPALATVVGADGTAADAVQAVVVAAGLVSVVTRELAASG